MIVPDASALLEVLLDTPRRPSVLNRLRQNREDLIAPDLVTVEVARVLRRNLRSGLISAEQADAALGDYLDLGIALYPITPMIEAVWGLRDNVTVEDAAYVVLAQIADATLLTTDQRLANAARATTEVLVEIP